MENIFLLKGGFLVQTKHVFLDTSIYIQNNFDFDGKTFQSLIDLVSEERVILYNTSITENEVLSNIKRRVDETRERVNSLKKAYVLRGTSPFQSIFIEKNPANKAFDEIIKKYESFKNNAEFKDIPLKMLILIMFFLDILTSFRPLVRRKR